MPEFVLAEQGIVVTLGLLLGSFLNVCIHRWPNDLSVVKPRSFCPHCERPIAAYDNIPVLSYLLLGGKCRHCKASISFRYPLVELLTALCFAWFTALHGLTLTTAANCVFAFLLIGLSFSDLETLLLPDELTLGGTLAGLAFSPVRARPRFVVRPDSQPCRVSSRSKVGLVWRSRAGSHRPGRDHVADRLSL